MTIDRKPILIAGPTASGKSALALALAERLNGAIVNADSMQVYRELRILTARPSPADEARLPHRLYAHVSASAPYSVARWLQDVSAVLAELRADGRTPILVGGTGLFFTALTQGLADIPPVERQIRETVRALLREEGAAALHARLAALDPPMADRLKPSDSQRIARALEVIESTGRSLAAWQKMPAAPLLPLEKAHAFVLELDRAVLYARIDRRLEGMIASGALEEARRFEEEGLADDAPAQKTLGLRPLIEHIGGERTLGDALAASQTQSRQYAKRQMTWFRNKMMSWNHINAQFSERSKHEIFSIITSRG